VPGWNEATDRHRREQQLPERRPLCRSWPVAWAGCRSAKSFRGHRGGREVSGTQAEPGRLGPMQGHW